MNFALVTVALLFSAQMSDGAAAMPNAGELSAANREAPQGGDNGEGVDANGERRICRRLTVSSSHRYRRVCLTARQWRAYDDQNS